MRAEGPHNKVYPPPSTDGVIMISYVAKKIFGTKNARVIKGMRPIVEHINSLEGGLQAKSDAELKGMTAEFRRRLDQGATLEDLLPEAFAVCREAGRRDSALFLWLLFALVGLPVLALIMAGIIALSWFVASVLQLVIAPKVD